MFFKEYILSELNAGAFLNTAFGFDPQTFGMGRSLNMPSPTLDIPTKTINSKVSKIFYTQNPICICLEDGTEWKITFKQWRYLESIGRKPKEGSRIQLELYIDGTIKAIDLPSNQIQQ